MRLYEIKQAILDCIKVNPETGEAEVDVEALEVLQMQRDEKLENAILLVKSKKAERDAIKAEEKILASRGKTLEREIASLSSYVQMILDGEKFKTARCAISYRTSSHVSVDESKLPKKWMRVSYTPDKTAIKDWLKSGHKIKGATIEESVSMIIK